ncbi:MAG: hypothetical protein IOD12_10015 [Silvanigrellales bacterium]|jgi:hypothetical protein|nr:hypothetical protein [Silvanigrellales bacterium]
MASIFFTRGALAAAFTGCALLAVGCGNAPVRNVGGANPSEKAPGSLGKIDDKGAGADANSRGIYDAEVQLLAAQLELDLVAQGMLPSDARTIALGGLEGSRAEVSDASSPTLGLLDLKSLIPGFLKGALGVAKTLFAGTPLGVAGTIVESVVKGVSKKADTPKDVLSTLPAVALEALLGKGNSAAGFDAKEALVALLASGRGIVALPEGNAQSGQSQAAPDVAKNMMQGLVAALANRPGADANQLASLLPALQDNLQSRILASNPQAADVLGAISEGQFAALLGVKGESSNTQALVNLLLKKGADAILTKVGVGDDDTRSKLLGVLAQAAAKPIDALKSGTALSKQEMVKTLVQTLTGSIMTLDARVEPLKKQALEASLLGLSKGVLSTNAVTREELADVFANVSNSLREDAKAKPAASADDELLEELLAVIARRGKES